MRRAIAALILTIAGLIPLLRYHPSTSALAGASATATAPLASGSSRSTPTPSQTSAGGQKTVNGSTVNTEFGPYQVQVVFTGNTISDVQLIIEPSDRHSQRIAEGAAPTLRQEALQAQSARIDTVSGATTTSEAYAQSLQAAIDSNRG